MDIGDGEAVSDAGEATDAHVLADGEEQLVLRILDGAVAGNPGAAHERVDVSGVLLGDDSSHALDKVVERLAVGDEVGLAVDLDHNTDTVDDGGVSHALSSHAAGLLRLRGEALFAQIHDGLFHIASHSMRAFLQSIRPQPVAWRSSLTTAAVIAILISS